MAQTQENVAERDRNTPAKVVRWPRITDRPHSASKVISRG